MPNGLIGVFGVLGVFGVRKACGEDACDTILSKLWEAFAKKRMEIAIASEFGLQDTRYLAFKRSGLRAARDHSNLPMLSGRMDAIKTTQ